MKLFIKILLFVLVSLITNVNVASAAITFPNIQEATISFSFHTEIPKSVFKAIENGIINCCQNGKDLLDYRNWGIGVEAKAAKTGTTFAEGSFSVFNWKGYPAGGIKPTGPFRLLEGAEYTSARNLANSTNAAMRRANPEMFKGLQIHEIHPVKFGGSPTDLSNKIFLTPSQHAQYTNFWNALMRSTK
jgi:hypothetical protein